MQRNTLMLDSRIQAFWQWFVEKEDDFQTYFTEEELVDKEGLIEDMDNRILDFGLFAWEIGPGVGRPFYLIISPNGSKERLSISKQIIEAAPYLPDWELHYARPPQENALQFSLYDDLMVEQAVDASVWHYVLLKPAGKKVEILLEAPNIRHLDPDTQQIAAEMALARLLGEEATIDYIYRTGIVEELEEELQRRRAPISALRQQL